MQRLSKSLVAVLSGLAMLFVLVQPSGASTGTVNSGHLGVNLTPALTTDLAPGTGPCPGLPSALSLNATSSGANGLSVTIHITGGAFTYGGATYFLSGITGHASGTINTSTTNFSVGPFSSTNGNIYAETSPGSCTIGSAVCSAVRLNTTTAPLNLTGSFPGGHTFAPPAITGTAVLNGSGGVQAAGCLPPFSALNGKTVTISNMNVTLV